MSAITTLGAGDPQTWPSDSGHPNDPRREEPTEVVFDTFITVNVMVTARVWKNGSVDIGAIELPDAIEGIDGDDLYEVNREARVQAGIDDD